MSITSSNNLAVNNSLTVNGNTMLGTNSTNTLIINSKPTFNSDITISGNINQTNGTFSTGSGNVNLNGDVVISGTKKLTTGTGPTTINGSLQCNSGLNISGLLSSAGSIELGPTTGTDFTYIDFKTTGGNDDYDARIGETGGLLSTSGKGALSFDSLSCAINSPLTANGITTNNNLTQTGTATFNAINCTSINNSGSFNGINCTSINNSGTLAQTGSITCNAINCSSISNSGTLAQTGSITCNAINCSSISNSGTLAQNGSITCNAINCSSISNSGTLTQNGAVACNAINCTSINNSGTLTQTGTANFNAINSISINNSGTLAQTGTITCNSINSTSINHSGTSTFNGITNNNTLNQNALANFSNLVKVNSGESVYITDAGLTNYLRMHHSGAAAYFDSTGGLNFRNGTTNNFNINGSTNQASFNYNLNTNGTTNNAALYQNSTATFSNAITAPSISTTTSSFYAGSGNNYDTSAISAPKVINGIATGTGDAAAYTQFNLAINSWQGVGFVYSNPSGPSICKLVIDTRTGNLNTVGNVTCNSINVNNNGELNSLYRNNIKNYNIRGYTSKVSGTHVYSWLLSSTQQTYTSDRLTLTIDSTCFSIQILYTYYSTGTNLYQGATPYYVIKYGSDGWISNGGSGNTQGAFQFQPLFNVSTDNTTLNIYHSEAVNNNDYVYFTYKVEMY